ncbi:MAG: hypothetical protein IKH04_07975 [Kiritimatiellae bacterium]|nr:hypothetical protein [Kiritimatiellia bacterium]
MTKAQLKPYWRAVGRAASALGLVGREAVEKYRHEVMMEEAGAEHARDVDSADGFDRVMYRLAVDAGDWGAAARFASGEERRMAHLVEQCARQVIELKQCEATPDMVFATEAIDSRAAALSYVVGVMRQAGYPVYSQANGDWWLDITGGMAFQVFRMLDTHRRRLLRRLGWSGPLSFDADASWHLDGAMLSVRHAGDIPLQLHVGRVPA